MTVFSRSDFTCDYDLGPCPDWTIITRAARSWTIGATPSTQWTPVPGPCDC